MTQLYGVLGVGPGADSAQVKSAYRKLAKIWHPDLHGGEERAERRFKEINHAYATLRDPKARATYDAALAAHRRCFRCAAVTMSATFAFTVSSGLFLANWLSGTHLF
jgi:curved DNA-binding protein CbpA